ncbi:MAG TPA: hypothetical protein VG816_11265 [Solirubrobacterales bacterium]|nr:hypothetical protein [Solirubrobacterales bacterium]
MARNFFHDLNHRAWDRACALMLPGTRDFVGGRKGCPHALLTHFRFSFDEFSFSTRHWSSARIVSKVSPTETRTGVSLSFRLAEAYRCLEVPRKKPCPWQRHRFTRPERMSFALDARHRWGIAKVGGVLGDMQLWGPDLTEGALFIPTDKAGLSLAAQMPAPSFSCEGALVGQFEDELEDVRGPDYETIRDTPWLDGLGLKLIRTSPDSICVAIPLLQPPHPDSEYSLAWHRPEGSHGVTWHGQNGQTIADQGAPAGYAEPNVEIAVDGDGIPHALINEVGATTRPALAPYLPRFGYSGNALQIELTPKQGFTMDRSWELETILDAAPSWSDSLLRKPLFAEDRIPGDQCLEYPTGQIHEEFFCQGPSG